MDTEISQPPTPDEPPLPIRTPRSPLNTVFHSDQGLRAGWRLVMYIVLILIFSEAFNLALARLIHQQKTSTPAPWQFFLLETLSFAIVFLPACLMARFERRPVGEYGLPLHSLFVARFWQGMGLCIAETTILMGCIAAFRGYTFG